MANVKKIVQLLLKKYPDPKIELRFNNPLELVIATILSAQCTDVKVNEVTKELFRKYKTAGQYAEAELTTFEQEIRPTGFYKNKAKMIIECCRQIVTDFNGKVPGTIEELTSLAGIGRKTANVILGSAFGKQTMGVDTHVLRVSNRLGLAHSKNPDKVEEELANQMPGNKLTSINLALVLHGRRTCKSKKPLCPDCVLYKECEWPDKVAN
jgi:endonuclease-3